MLYEVITNAIIKQYKKLFSMDDIDFSITDGALDYIVNKAVEYKLGARGLRSLCEEILTDAMFELPSSNEKKLNITKMYAEEKISKSTIKKLKAVSYVITSYSIHYTKLYECSISFHYYLVIQT